MHAQPSPFRRRARCEPARRARGRFDGGGSQRARRAGPAAPATTLRSLRATAASLRWQLIDRATASIRAPRTGRGGTGGRCGASPIGVGEDDAVARVQPQPITACSRRDGSGPPRTKARPRSCAAKLAARAEALRRPDQGAAGYRSDSPPKALVLSCGELDVARPETDGLTARSRCGDIIARRRDLQHAGACGPLPTRLTSRTYLRILKGRQYLHHATRPPWCSG